MYRSLKYFFRGCTSRSYQVFFFCSLVVVVADPVAAPDIELSGGPVFFLLGVQAFNPEAAICFLFFYPK